MEINNSKINHSGISATKSLYRYIIIIIHHAAKINSTSAHHCEGETVCIADVQTKTSMAVS